MIFLGFTGKCKVTGPPKVSIIKEDFNLILFNTNSVWLWGLPMSGSEKCRGCYAYMEERYLISSYNYKRILIFLFF